MTVFQRTPKPAASVPKPDVMPTFDARDLVQEGAQARLVLDDQTYFLRITRAGKLILTK